jgi:F-type H+-transporting ATPase subunit delta
LRSRDVARKIAETLYALASDEKTTDALERELRQIAASTDVAPPAAGAAAGEAGRIVKAAFPEASDGFRHLMGLLIRDLVLGEFLSVRAEAEGVVPVHVVTAQALSSEERDRLTGTLGHALGLKVRLEESVDPAVLAGARIEIEGRTLDGTLRAKLDRLHEVLGESGGA